MPGTPTTKYAIPTLSGSTLARDIDTETNAALTAIDSKFAGYSAGVLASRPTSTGGTPGIAGRRYRATDTGQVFEDTGTSWIEILTDSHADELGLSVGATRRGKSIVAAAEAITNTTYGLLTTPDRVQSVVLPTDGLIAVAYQALWKESVVNQAMASVFLGATQAQIANPFGTGTLPVDRRMAGQTVTNRYRHLASASFGLYSPTNDPGATDAGPTLTTGQIVAGDQATGGPFFIFAAAGTYDVSVRFKSSSGSVTVKERKLWVWTMGF